MAKLCQICLNQLEEIQRWLLVIFSFLICKKTTGYFRPSEIFAAVSGIPHSSPYISGIFRIYQGAAQGHLDCLYQNPKLTKIPCFRLSGMSGESIERQASLASQRSLRSFRTFAALTTSWSLRSHHNSVLPSVAHATTKNEKRKINSVLPSVAHHNTQKQKTKNKFGAPYPSNLQNANFLQNANLKI